MSGVKYHRAGQEGVPGGWEGHPSLRQLEGSQHTGIAEIVSSEPSFIPQLFFNSGRDEQERKSQGSRGIQEEREASKPLTPSASVS